jgi:hypothetical protein
VCICNDTGNEGGLLPGNVESLADLPSKERYRKKLRFTGGKNLYEILKRGKTMWIYGPQLPT